ncbi:hypothetical protein ACIOG8_19465 [Streptomyces erythrochromogenes]|uniref:hypothetical protein n=1 Tax=Streptomyces erythrochromogenes TaxID=285574 RepID=UPI0038054079
MHWHALNDERVRESLEAEYRRWRRCFVTLFRVLADERDAGPADGRDVDPLALGEAVAAAVDGLAEVDSGPVLRTLIRTLAADARA